jgi:hypothetical protein
MVCPLHDNPDSVLGTRQTPRTTALTTPAHEHPKEVAPMEIYMNQPNDAIAFAASTAALVALPCATSASLANVQGSTVPAAWDAVDATVVVKRERTAGICMRHLGFATPSTAQGSPAWSPPL